MPNSPSGPGLASLLAFERLAQRIVGQFSPRFGPSIHGHKAGLMFEKFARDPEAFAKKSRFSSKPFGETRCDLALELAEQGDYRPWIALCESGAAIHSHRFQGQQATDTELLLKTNAPPEALRALALANFDPFFSPTGNSALNWHGLCATELSAGLETHPRVQRALRQFGKRLASGTPAHVEPTDGEAHFFGVLGHNVAAAAKSLALASPARVAPLAEILAGFIASPNRRRFFLGAMAFAVATDSPSTIEPLRPVLEEAIRADADRFFAGVDLACRELPGFFFNHTADAASEKRVAVTRLARLAADACGFEVVERAAPLALREALKPFFESRALAQVVADSHRQARDLDGQPDAKARAHRL